MPTLLLPLLLLLLPLLLLLLLLLMLLLPLLLPPPPPLLLLLLLLLLMLLLLYWCRSYSWGRTWACVILHQGRQLLQRCRHCSRQSGCGMLGCGLTCCSMPAAGYPVQGGDGGAAGGSCREAERGGASMRLPLPLHV
jgi:hypothetical protein